MSRTPPQPGRPPLDGVRVADFSELLPGPFLTQTLVEMGASVIKIERPPNGDGTRVSLPGLFKAVNRGKGSLALNLKSPEDLAEARALIAESDIVVEGYRPGVMKRLGLDYEALRADHPRLIYLSLSGYGQTGPLVSVPGHDLNYLASVGATSLCGAPGTGPDHTIGLPIADLGGAMYGVSAILAALYQRERTGLGQYLDLSIADCMAHWVNPRRGPYHEAGMTTLEQQREFALTRPAYGVFPVQDGAITIAALEAHFWRALIRELGLSQFEGGAYETRAARVAACAEINAAIAEAIAPMTRDAAVARLLAQDIPAAPVLTVDEAAQSEQFAVRGLAVETDAGPLTPFPVRLSGMPEMPTSAPTLDQTRRTRS